MATQIDNEILKTFTTVAPFKDLKKIIKTRFNKLSNSIELAYQPGIATESLTKMAQDLATIPTHFQKHDTN